MQKIYVAHSCEHIFLCVFSNHREAAILSRRPLWKGGCLTLAFPVPSLTKQSIPPRSFFPLVEKKHTDAPTFSHKGRRERLGEWFWVGKWPEGKRSSSPFLPSPSLLFKIQFPKIHLLLVKKKKIMENDTWTWSGVQPHRKMCFLALFLSILIRFAWQTSTWMP